MGKVKMTQAEESAMKIQAMIQGVSFEELVSDSLLSDDSDNEDIEIEVEDEKKEKKTRKKKSEDKPVTVRYLVPELEQFSKLNRDLKISVNYHAHDIPYKEQLWNIPSRIIDYNVEIVKNIKEAKDIADMFSKGTAEEREKAAAGTIRYFKITNWEENVPYKIKVIAYIKVVESSGKFKTQLILKSKLLKENHADPEKVKNTINKILKKLAA